MNTLFNLQEFTPDWIAGVPSHWKIGMRVKSPTFAYRGEEKIGEVIEITILGVVARFERMKPNRATGRTHDDYYITGDEARVVTAWQEGRVSS